MSLRRQFMSDLIRRQDALQVAFKSPFFSDALIEEIKSLPSEDRPIGHIVTSGIYPTVWAECSECGKPIDARDEFCRHCGVKMEGAE
jgi:hypothetical protein